MADLSYVAKLEHENKTLKTILATLAVRNGGKLEIDERDLIQAWQMEIYRHPTDPTSLVIRAFSPLPEPNVADPQPDELHLTDGEIRQSVIEHLKANGWAPKADTLRIYGYGEDRNRELSEFQGHIRCFAMKKKT